MTLYGDDFVVSLRTAEEPPPPAQRETFLEGLMALWSRGGRKSAWQLAERTGLPPARFEFLFRPSNALPDWEDVEALLFASGEPPQVQAGWHRRWQRLRLTAYGHVPTRRQPDEEARQLLRQALDARDPVVFVRQLDSLRKLRNMSFADVAKASGGQLPRSTAHWMVQPGKFPSRADQVKAFVQACQVHDLDDVADWLAAYSRAATRQRAHATLRETTARHAGINDTKALEEASDALARQGAHGEAIRLLKEALNEQRAHSAELEAQLNDLTP